ncbi:MAG: sensor histidine kinase [Actinobacteria bacterium]|nr:sensor histidine kinase [Actinomycetota bacterium]
MKVNRLLVPYWSLAKAVPVRVKIMGIVLGLVLLLGVGVIFQIRAIMNQTLADELDKRAVSITSYLASHITDFVLTNNTFVIYEHMRDLLDNNEDIKYAFIADSSGEVIASTFGARLPDDLLGANRLIPHQEYNLEILDTEEGLIHDVAVPILEGEAGVVRIGFSEQYFRGVVAVATRWLILITALVSLAGIFAAYLLTAVITRPIRGLVEATKAVAKGDLKYRAAMWANDEIGHLGAAFNTMIEKLELARNEIMEKEKMRTQLIERVISAQEEERKRIARELHDETSQYLTSLMVGLKIAQNASNMKEARERTAELRTLIEKTLEGVHNLALELRLSVLDDLGLVAAVQKHIREYSRELDIQMSLRTIGMDKKRLPPDIETALYRIVQEALSNVVKHAGAKRVEILLEHRGSSVVAKIKDDGKGFDVDKVMNPNKEERRLGIFGMYERASLMGGVLTLKSRPAHGTTVFIEIPLDGEETFLKEGEMSIEPASISHLSKVDER